VPNDGAEMRFHGVSVEKVEEGLKALEYPGVVSVQIIYNMVRRQPDGLFVEQARKRRALVIARVLLASGLLAGKFKAHSKFDAHDHLSSTATAKRLTLTKPSRLGRGRGRFGPLFRRERQRRSLRCNGSS
jgi:aryl-alcohol dehydrogenase-like predicted oxidoreductase